MRLSTLSMASTCSGGELGGCANRAGLPKGLSSNAAFYYVSASGGSTRASIRRIMRRSISRLCFLLVLLHFAACHAEVTVRSRSSPPVTVASSQFFHFASLGVDEILNASAVILLEDACRPQKSTVKDKIVILPWINSWVHGRESCTLSEAYWLLADAGALAYITIPVTPHSRPGRWSYRFDSWEHLEKLKEHEQPPIMAEIARFDHHHHDSIIGDWETSGKDGTLRVVIGPPFDTFFMDHYASWTWIVLFRVLPPLFSFFVTLTALSIVITGSRSSIEEAWSVGSVVCAFEGFATAIIGGALATGLYGPMVGPFKFYISLMTLLGGFACTSQVLLLLFMQESARAIALRYRRKNVWSLHKWKLIAFLVAANILDMTFPIDFMDRSSSYVSLASWIFGAILFFVVALVYSVRAHWYSLPLRQHMRSAVLRPNEAKIRRLVFFLRLSSVCISVGAVMRVVILLLWNEGVALLRDILILLGVWSRIIGSYSLICAIAPSTPAQTFATLARWLPRPLLFDALRSPSPSAKVGIAIEINSLPLSDGNERSTSNKVVSDLTKDSRSKRSSQGSYRSRQSTLVSIDETRPLEDGEGGGALPCRLPNDTPPPT